MQAMLSDKKGLRTNTIWGWQLDPSWGSTKKRKVGRCGVTQGDGESWMGERARHTEKKRGSTSKWNVKGDNCLGVPERKTPSYGRGEKRLRIGGPL